MSELLTGRRILVVEDEMMILLMIEDLLADLGCASVTSAATVEDALALIAAQHFDAATLDVNLGGRDSYAIADALAARGIPFAFSTGYVGDGLRSDHRDRAVLRKPFRTDEFIGIFAMLIGEAAAGAAGEAVAAG